MLTSSLNLRQVRRPCLKLAAITLAVAGVSACNDPLGVKATLAVRFDTLSAYAMSGTPLTYPAAYSAAAGLAVRVEPDIAFDVAFDLDATGKVKLVPARQVSATRNVGGIPQATQRIGLLPMKGSFESVTKAPNTGSYKYDSTLVVIPGETVTIEFAGSQCQFSLNQNQYAKLVVDSIKTQSRRIFFRAARDPNCGFRSLTPGVPKS